MFDFMTLMAQEDGSSMGPIAMFVATYTALFGTVAGVVEMLKKAITKGWLDGKEQYAAFLLAPGLGYAAQRFMGLFEDVALWGHMVICVAVGGAVAGLIHDTILKQVIAIVKPAASTAKKKGKKTKKEE